jgi:hypothetical protein
MPKWHANSMQGISIRKLRYRSRRLKNDFDSFENRFSRSFPSDTSFQIPHAKSKAKPHVACMGFHSILRASNPRIEQEICLVSGRPCPSGRLNRPLANSFRAFSPRKQIARPDPPSPSQRVGRRPLLGTTPTANAAPCPSPFGLSDKVPSLPDVASLLWQLGATLGMRPAARDSCAR